MPGIASSWTLAALQLQRAVTGGTPATNDELKNSTSGHCQRCFEKERAQSRPICCCKIRLHSCYNSHPSIRLLLSCLSPSACVSRQTHGSVQKLDQLTIYLRRGWHISTYLLQNQVAKPPLVQSSKLHLPFTLCLCFWPDSRLCCFQLLPKPSTSFGRQLQNWPVGVRAARAKISSAQS